MHNFHLNYPSRATISHEIVEISSHDHSRVEDINANNEFVNTTYLALYNPLKEAHTPPNKTSSDSVRMAWIMKKYVLKKWYQSCDSSTLTSDTYSTVSSIFDSYDVSNRYTPTNNGHDELAITYKYNETNIDAVQKLLVKDSRPQQPHDAIIAVNKKHKHIPSILINSKGQNRNKSKRVTFKDECISYN